MDRLTVLSLEQALSLSYATQRFVHLGWRVIRIEATPSGRGLPGDPNRYVGKEIDHPDLRAYFIGPNVGKASISLDLKSPTGRDTLKKLIAKLPVDIFACNTLPKRYKELGIDYETLSEVNPRLIWAGLSAMGPDYPDVPGYDPALQALSGYMDVTGDPTGPPMLCGVPFVDLKAGDEVFANVCLALAKREQTGEGCRIDVSMLQAAASWLVTTMPLLDLGYSPAEVRRNGNEHREFVPVNAYPTSDGYVYLAIGNDLQWKRLIAIDAFAGLASPVRDSNEGRRSERESIHREMADATRQTSTDDLVEMLTERGIVAAPIHSIPESVEFPAIRDRLLETQTQSGQRIRLPPPSTETAYLASRGRKLPYAPRYGQDTVTVLKEAGLTSDEITGLKTAGVIA